MWNEFDPDTIGRDGFDIVFGQNISGRAPQPFDLVKKLYDVTTKKGLLFVHGIVVDSRIASEVIKKWQDSEHQFAFNEDIPGDELSSSGFTILNIAIRKTTDSLFAPEPTDILVKARGRIYQIVTYAV